MFNCTCLTVSWTRTSRFHWRKLVTHYRVCHVFLFSLGIIVCHPNRPQYGCCPSICPSSAVNCVTGVTIFISKCNISKLGLGSCISRRTFAQYAGTGLTDYFFSFCSLCWLFLGCFNVSHSPSETVIVQRDPVHCICIVEADVWLKLKS